MSAGCDGREADAQESDWPCFCVCVQTHIAVLVRCAYFLIYTMVPFTMTVDAFRSSLPMVSADVVLYYGDMQLCRPDVALVWYVGVGPAVIRAFPKKVKAFAVSVNTEWYTFSVVVQDDWRISALREQVAYNMGMCAADIVFICRDQCLCIHWHCSMLRGARRVDVFLRHGLHSMRNYSRTGCSLSI